MYTSVTSYCAAVTFTLAVTNVVEVEAVPRYRGPMINYTISELDEGVYKLISQPEAGRADELYQLLYTLHLRMLHIHEVVHFNIDDPTAVAEAKDIVARDGLHIFKLSIDEEHLKSSYNYINNHLYEIVDLVKNCQRLYNSSAPIIKDRDDL